MGKKKQSDDSSMDVKINLPANTKNIEVDEISSPEGKTKTNLQIADKDFKNLEVKVRDHIRRTSVRREGV